MQTASFSSSNVQVVVQGTSDFQRTGIVTSAASFTAGSPVSVSASLKVNVANDSRDRQAKMRLIAVHSDGTSEVIATRYFRGAFSFDERGTVADGPGVLGGAFDRTISVAIATTWTPAKSDAAFTLAIDACAGTPLTFSGAASITATG